MTGTPPLLPGAAVTNWLAVSPNDRRKQLGQVFVDRPTTAPITAEIERLRRSLHCGIEPTCVMLIGEPGVGKSRYLEQFVLRNPPRRVNGSIVRPVLHIVLKSSCTPLDVAQTLARKLFDPRLDVTFPDPPMPPDLADKAQRFSRGKLTDVGERVKVQMAAQGVEIAIIDDFQHLVEDGGQATINRGANWLKFMVKSIGNIVPIFAGVEKMESLILENDQLEDITPARFRLTRFDFAEPHEKRAFREFLAAVDLRLPFNNPAGIAEERAASILYAATRGRLRPLFKLLLPAAERAIERGSPVMTDDDLAFGLDCIALSANLGSNPFRDGSSCFKEAA